MATRQTAQDLMNPADVPEKILRRNMAGRCTTTLTEDVDKARPTKREENGSGVILNMAEALAAAKAARDEKKSKCILGLALKRAGYGLVCNSS